MQGHVDAVSGASVDQEPGQLSELCTLRTQLVAVAVARVLAERRDAAVNAIGMVFPTISVG